METMTRTLRQWTATVRHLREAARRPGWRELSEFPARLDLDTLACRIERATMEAPTTGFDAWLSIALSDADRALIDRHAPMDAWWMPATPGPLYAERQQATIAASVVAEAEAIIRAHQQGRR